MTKEEIALQIVLKAIDVSIRNNESANIRLDEDGYLHENILHAIHLYNISVNEVKG